jgi:hypothetical protein
MCIFFFLDIVCLLVESANSHLIVSKQNRMVMCEYSHQKEIIVFILILITPCEKKPNDQIDVINRLEIYRK